MKNIWNLKEMDSKRFEKKDETFICIKCNSLVEKLNYTTRDHCNFCLSSIHIDILPGDRKNTCLGELEPIDVEKGKKDSLKIVYKCKKCKEIKRNISAIDDNYEEILKIMERKSL